MQPPTAAAIDTNAWEPEAARRQQLLLCCLDRETAAAAAAATAKAATAADTAVSAAAAAAGEGACTPQSVYRPEEGASREQIKRIQIAKGVVLQTLSICSQQTQRLLLQASSPAAVEEALQRASAAAAAATATTAAAAAPQWLAAEMKLSRAVHSGVCFVMDWVQRQRNVCGVYTPHATLV